MASQKGKIINLEGIKPTIDAFVVIVNTEWNKQIVDVLTADCIKILEKKGAVVDIITVPGAVEIPFAINKYHQISEEKDTNEFIAEGYLEDEDEEPLFNSNEIIPDAYIALGCVIKGETAHFDYVCNSVTQGLTQLNLTVGVPVINMVLTVFDEQQAIDRIGGKAGNKGEEAAETALKMINVVRDIESRLF
jgi:6,7-dimethyl-8-ribityllumazine synthase